MRDLTERALDTATSLGAGYADTRVVRRLDESIAIKTGRVEGVASNESEGFGVRVDRRRRVGLREQPRAEPRRRPIASPPRRCASPAPAPPRFARAGRSRAAPAARGSLRDPDRGGSVQRSRSSARSPTSLAADQAAARVKGIAFTESMYAAQREWKTFAATDGVVHRADDHPRRLGGRGQRGRRRRASAPVLPGLRRRLAGGRLRVHPRPRRSADRAEPLAEEAVALLTAPQCPQRAVHDRARSLAALPPGPRELRPPDRARPGLRDRGVVRRDELPHDRQAGRGLPLRLGSRDDRRGRDGARRHGHVRLGRRGGRRPGRAARPGRGVRRLPQQPRDGATHRAVERRRDARRRLEPDPADPDDQHQPAAPCRG